MALVTLLFAVLAAQASVPAGKMIDLDGRRLHLNCTGSGTPTVLIETGLGSFSTEWAAVQRADAAVHADLQLRSRRISSQRPGSVAPDLCAANLELHEALSRAGERAPLVLVAHSFGVASFALTPNGTRTTSLAWSSWTSSASSNTCAWGRTPAASPTARKGAPFRADLERQR